MSKLPATSGTITDKKYPKCSALGILRRTTKGSLTVSTQALHEALGWEAYRGFLSSMKHSAGSTGFVTPDSCEKWLATLNGKLKK